MISWLEKNDIEMYSTQNVGESVVAERFIRSLKTKIYKNMTWLSKHVYISKLDDILNKYNNTYHRTIKMKSADVTPSTYIDFDKENSKEGSKFEVSDNVRTSRYKNIFVKGYFRKWYEEVFVIS